MARLPPIPPLLVVLKPPPPALFMRTPIDVDTTRKARSLSLQGCYRYGDVNHVVRDCPHCMDVCQLTSEQREELIEDLLALKDVVPLEEFGSLEEEDFA